MVVISIFIQSYYLVCQELTADYRLQTQNRNCNFENNVKISLDDSDALPGHHYANLVLVLGYILSNFHFLILDRIESIGKAYKLFLKARSKNIYVLLR